MKKEKANLLYEQQHLVISEHAVSTGAEWVPQSPSWTVHFRENGVAAAAHSELGRK